jgi:RecG-like helicase
MSPPENKISPLKNPASRDEATPELRRPITSLWGVGAERAAQLARLEIFTIEDLLLHRPKRYEDRRHFRKISELTKDEPFHHARKNRRARPEKISRRQQIRF